MVAPRHPTLSLSPDPILTQVNHPRSQTALGERKKTPQIESTEEDFEHKNQELEEYQARKNKAKEVKDYLEGKIKLFEQSKAMVSNGEDEIDGLEQRQLEEERRETLRRKRGRRKPGEQTRQRILALMRIKELHSLSSDDEDLDGEDDSTPAIIYEELDEERKEEIRRDVAMMHAPHFITREEQKDEEEIGEEKQQEEEVTEVNENEESDDSADDEGGIKDEAFYPMEHMASYGKEDYDYYYEQCKDEMAKRTPGTSIKSKRRIAKCIK